MHTLINLAANTVIVLTTAAFTLNHDQVKGVGEPIKKVVTVEPFHGIEVNGSMDVEVVKADVQAV